MIVAVPNIISTLDKSKRRTYIEDAKKMIALAEYRVRSDTSIEFPTNENTAVAFTLSSMDLTDFSEGPEGGQYDLNRSYVLLVKKNGKYLYSATLVEKYGSKYRGVNGIDYDDLLSETAVNKVEEFKSSNLPVAPTVNGYKVIYNYRYVINNVISEKNS